MLSFKGKVNMNFDWQIVGKIAWINSFEANHCGRSLGVSTSVQQVLAPVIVI